MVQKYLKYYNSILYLLSYLEAGICLRLYISYNSCCQFTHACYNKTDVLTNEIWINVKYARHSTQHSTRIFKKNSGRKNCNLFKMTS